VAEGEEMKKQPRHLVGIQDNGSLGLINRNNQNIQNYFLRVTPTNWHSIWHSDILSGILSGIFSGIYLTFHLASYLAFFTAFYLRYILTFYLAWFPAFYPTYVPTFYPAFFLAFYLSNTNTVFWNFINYLVELNYFSKIYYISFTLQKSLIS
jgi:hypothetical protein